MGNSSVSNVFFGDNIPEELQSSEAFRADQKSLQEVEESFGSDKEKQALAQLLSEVEPAALEENRALCEFIALASLRFRRYDLTTARERLTKYLAWRRQMFGNLAPQDIDALGDAKYGESEDTEAEEGAGDASGTSDKKPARKTTRDMLGLGVLSVLPKSTPKGQRILYLSLSRTQPANFKHHARHVVKATHWACMSLLRQSPRCQARGIVAVVNFEGTTLANVDRKVPPKMGRLLSGILPVRIAGILICNPNMLVRVVVPLAKMFMSEKIANRMHVITDVETLPQVFGLSKDILPAQLGGESEPMVPLEPEAY